MVHWGKTPAGTPRWRCQSCDVSSVRTRKDSRHHKRLSLFVRWMTTKISLVELAQDQRVSMRTLQRWFESFWREPPKSHLKTDVRVLVVDATSVVRRRLMLLVAGDGDENKPLFWNDAPWECFDTWEPFLRHLARQGLSPEYVVCDAQKGLLKAIREVWPETKVQRCVIHIIRQALIWLTRSPKTQAGQELRRLVVQLSSIRTKREKRRWIRSFRRWCKKYDRLLKERSYAPTGRWWYTHRKVRAVRSLLKNALPDMFRYVTDPTVPKTSNHVEGGLNARLKELFRCHRGLSGARRLVLASWYLALRQGQKPTRDVH